MSLLNFVKKTDHNLVVVMYEGPQRLRLNGNRKQGRRLQAAKRGAACHEQTVCWIEFTQGGKRVDEGFGPAAKKISLMEAEKILRELPFHPACKAMLRDLEAGKERASRMFG